MAACRPLSNRFLPYPGYQAPRPPPPHEDGLVPLPFRVSSQFESLADTVAESRKTRSDAHRRLDDPVYPAGWVGEVQPAGGRPTLRAAPKPRGRIEHKESQFVYCNKMHKPQLNNNSSAHQSRHTTTSPPRKRGPTTPSDMKTHVVGAS